MLEGPSSALAENMGHCYNALGDYENAERCFTEALDNLSQSKLDHAGGTFLGLGVLKNRLGKHEEALVLIQRGLDYYNTKYAHEHNLQAKAHTSLATTYEHLGRFVDAERHWAEAVRIFLICCGEEDSPLTYNARTNWGKCLLQLGRKEEGMREFIKGFQANQAWENAQLPGSVLEKKRSSVGEKPTTVVTAPTVPGTARLESNAPCEDDEVPALEPIPSGRCGKLK